MGQKGREREKMEKKGGRREGRGGTGVKEKGRKKGGTCGRRGRGVKGVGGKGGKKGGDKL